MVSMKRAMETSSDPWLGEMMRRAQQRTAAAKPMPAPKCGTCRDLPRGCPNCRGTTPIAYRIGNAGVPRDMVEFHFESTPGAVRGQVEGHPAPREDVIDAVRRAVEGGDSVLVVGPNGSGKTGLMVSAVAYAVERGMRAKFWFVPILLRKLQSSHRADSERSIDEWLDLLGGESSPEILALDDLGAEEGITDATRNVVGTLVWMRDANGRQTLVTSNHPPRTVRGTTGLVELYGSRAGDRMRDWRLVTLTNPSVRGRR